MAVGPMPLPLLTQEAANAWGPGEIEAAISNLGAGAVVAFLLYRFVRRVRWPRPFTLRFVLLNLAAAVATGVSWLVLAGALSLLFGAQPLAQSRWWTEHLLLGTFLYAVVVAITYPVEAAARVARAEALAARAQLAALRAQLHPHFLFNALHAVVQLIPVDPARAADAAELVGSLLRASLEEDRDEVTLEEEWAFVSRYLDVERIRFGDRLRVRTDIAPELLDQRVPTFALQTLVENAVRHGAAHRVAATEIVVTAAATAGQLTISVRNTGDAPASAQMENGAGTGLARLRDRLAMLYGGAARLDCGAAGDGGFEAVMVVPRRRGTP